MSLSVFIIRASIDRDESWDSRKRFHMAVEESGLQHNISAENAPGRRLDEFTFQIILKVWRRRLA